MSGVGDLWLRILDERERMTPKSGYNVLLLAEYDPSKPAANRLTLLRHVDTWEQAQAAKTMLADLMPDDEDNLLVYPTQRRAAEPSSEIFDEIFRAAVKDEFNPYHDDIGRFTDADGTSTISFGNRDSDLTKALKADIATRASYVDKIVNAATGKDGKPLQRGVDADLDSKVDSIRQALMVLSPEDLGKLESHGLIIDDKVNARGSIAIPSLTGGAANAFYLSTTNDPNGPLAIINSVLGTKYQPGQIVIGTGAPPETLYSIAIHEAHHAKWDSIREDVDDLKLDTAATSDREFAKSSFSREYDRVMSDPVLQDSFKAAFGSYGSKEVGDFMGRNNDMNRQEGFTTMAEAYYVGPDFRFETDKEAGRTGLAPTQANEHYFDTARKAFPELKGLMDRWENLSTLTLGGNR